jgi:hypothetical protein
MLVLWKLETVGRRTMYGVRKLRKGEVKWSRRKR